VAAFYISRGEDAIGVEHREGASEGGLESPRASLQNKKLAQSGLKALPL
jgi:hypothetical protein